MRRQETRRGKGDRRGLARRTAKSAMDAAKLPSQGRGIDVPGQKQALEHREEGAPDADRQEHADIGSQPVGRRVHGGAASNGRLLAHWWKLSPHAGRDSGRPQSREKLLRLQMQPAQCCPAGLARGHRFTNLAAGRGMRHISAAAFRDLPPCRSIRPISASRAPLTSTPIGRRRPGAEVEGADPIAGDIEVDVAIIGGGYTGLSTAYHLGREHGIAAHVLEAHRIGWGCSGRNGGFCSIGIGKDDFGDWVGRFGLDAAKRVFEQGREAVRDGQGNHR